MRHTILVLNSKGGCGKTTIATNLASHYVQQGLRTALIDYDPQGSATRWQRLRGENDTEIHVIAAYRQSRNAAATRTWQLTPPAGTERVIIDAPAGVQGFDLQDFVRRVDTILIPVLPSTFDVHATADFIRDLLLVGKARTYNTRLGVVANRVKPRTNAYQSLQNFLRTLSIPLIASLRETQNYVNAAEQGLGIREMPEYLVRNDLAQWEPLLAWLDEGSLRSMAGKSGIGA
jgi:chromosome partitioning protein